MGEIKKSFRASYGLDAAGEKVINVAKADKTVLTDGVNVEYLIQENTVQQYDSTRAYEKSFVVIFNDRMWIAEQDIPKPAGTFNEGFWRPIRTDPKWYPVDSGVYQLQVGDYITVDSSQGNSVELTLPSNAQEGDNIIVKDIGGQVGYTDVVIKAGLQSIIDRGTRLIQAQMTIPYSQWLFVYVNKLWTLYNGAEADLGRTVRAGGPYRIQSGETIIRQYDRQEPIILTFPKNANQGDLIHFVGMDASAIPYFHLELNTFDANTSLIAPGIKSRVIQRSLSGYFSYNATTKTWMLYDADMTDRLRTVSSDTNLFPNETVSVVGTNNVTSQTINLTLPQNVEPGDQVTIALNYMRLGQTVNILPSGTDKILTDKNLMQFPKRSSYPPANNWVNVTSLSFNGATDYPPVITFAYIDMGPIKQWLVVKSLPALERVDPTNDSTRGRLGVIALATQAQANLDHENITTASKEVAITPETLSNRVATETRRGIARISTQPENNYPSDSASYADDTIVTPKKLDAKQATETMRGLAEIATQDEANGSTDDARIITAKKLDARRASSTMAGVAPLVTLGGAPGILGSGQNRDRYGTYIYNWNDNSNIVTPATLRELKATNNALGTVYLATSAEVIAGTATTFAYPLAVTPEALHTKTATEARIGFTQTATQAETNAGVDDFKYITPLKFNNRVATETLTGIARIATQAEFDAGTLNTVISTPEKLRTFFSRSTRTGVNAASGLTQAGDIWSQVYFNVLQSTETQRGTLAVSTQVQTDTGTDDLTAVTPKKLHAKKATESAEGIVQFATKAETVTGTLINKAVSPASLINAIQVDSTWRAQTTVRGTVKMTENALTFIGNDVAGSTAPLDSYEKTGYAISPYEFNKTLANFLPKNAKAADSNLLDGIDSTQFIRKDIDQTVAGSLTLTALTTTANVRALGVITGGLTGGVKNTWYPTFAAVAPTLAGVWNHAVYDDTSTSRYRIAYSIGAKTSLEMDSDGNVIVPWGYLSVSGNITTNNNITSSKAITANTAFLLGANQAVGYLDAYTMGLGNTGQSTTILTTDANTLAVRDGSTYTILNTKNMQYTLNPYYVRKAGDSMTGRLTVSAPVTFNVTQSIASPNTGLSSSNFGSWVSDITDSAIYNTMRGYLVAIPDINNDTGQPTGYIKEYQEFKGPGTLSQFGSSATDGSGTYQIWAPRPSAANANLAGHIAGTFYMRQWNPVKNQWDGWGRVYTSNNPPTASDIGAMANNGSVFDTLKIRDWIQIGNVRIQADPVTKTVVFDWID